MVSQEHTNSDGPLGMYINLEMYQLIVVWSNKRFTCCTGENYIFGNVLSASARAFIWTFSWKVSWRGPIF